MSKLSANFGKFSANMSKLSKNMASGVSAGLVESVSENWMRGVHQGNVCRVNKH